MAKKKSKGKRETRNGVKEVVLDKMREDAYLSRLSDKTLERAAGKFAALAAENPDMLRVISSPRGGGRSVFGAQMLGDLQKMGSPYKVSMKKLKEMRLSAQVAFGEAAIKAPLIGTLSTIPAIVSEDPEVAGFVRAALRPIWRSTVSSSMNGVGFGFQEHEKEWEHRDITWYWKTQEGLRESTIKSAWLYKKLRDVDPEGVVLWEHPESHDYGGFTNVKSPKEKDIVPADKSFLFTPELEFGNLYGKPRFLYAYKPWYMYECHQFFSARYFERFGEPGLAVGYDPKPTQDANGTQELYPGQNATKAAENYKGGGLYMYPMEYDDDGNLLYSFEIVKDDRRGADWIKILDFYLKMILRGLLIPDRALQQDTQVGSFASSKTYQKQWVMMQQQTIESFIDHANMYLVRQLIDLNLGIHRADAYLVSPTISDQNKAMMRELVISVLKTDESVRELVDWANLLVEHNLPIIKAAVDQEPDETAGSAGLAGGSATLADFAKPAAGLETTASQLLDSVEKKLSESSKPVREKILSVEEDMKKTARKFLEAAELDEEGKLVKSEKNEKLLKATLRGVDEAGADLEEWWEGDDARRAEKYLEGFGEKGIEDAETLAKLYGVAMPAGWKKAIRSEVGLARSFGAALRSFLENVRRAAVRTGSGMRELLTEGLDRREVVDVVKRNARFLRKTADGTLGAAFRAWRGGLAMAGDDVLAALPGIETKAGADVGLWKKELVAAGAAAVVKHKLDSDDKKELTGAVKGAGEKLEKADLMDESEGLAGRVEDYSTHRGYVDLTVEAPARGAYRWALWAAANLAGWDVWKFFRGPKTTMVGGKPAASSEEYDGRTGTLGWWQEQARKQGVTEPLQLYMFHYGDRDYAFPMPAEYAEEKKIDVEKAGGE